MADHAARWCDGVIRCDPATALPPRVAEFISTSAVYQVETETDDQKGTQQCAQLPHDGSTAASP